jgi:predicted phage baseplate assembly protein
MGEEIVHIDYKADGGVTLRFGDNEFGLTPARGLAFKVSYRVGNGNPGNVSDGALNSFDPEGQAVDEAGESINAGDLIESVTNPLPALCGIQPESLQEARQYAPDAFRQVTLRAVTPADFVAMAERLPWVQQAGARLRWTGSWLSAFVTPDPLGATYLAAERRAELTNHLDRVRQAGREVHVREPKFASLDIEVKVCVEPWAYAGHVKERVLQALVGPDGPLGEGVFFSPDNFTFGTPLERSALEAHVQNVSGVRAVEYVRIRRRGRFAMREFSEMVYLVANNEVIRVENDPNHPERGSLWVATEGGA